MMKNAALIFCLLQVFIFRAMDKGEESRLEEPLVKVLSDTIDASVPAGKTLIVGKVYFDAQMDPYTYEYRLCDSSHSAFYKVGEGKKRRVDRNGSFSVMIDASEKYLTFTYKGAEADLFETIYLENYPFQGGHRLEIEVQLPLKSHRMDIIVDKPVIYAYSPVALDFQLKLKPKGDLAFTYPVLGKEMSWNMQLDAAGRMQDVSGAEYPYLFWEARQKAETFQTAACSSNEIVLRDHLLSYLELSLTSLGLNAREKTDFITYWCPKLMNEPLVQVQFFVDEECSVIGELGISPKPDALRRVYVLFRPMNRVPVDFEAKILESAPFDRSGFVILEWGGSELKNVEL
jgi:hypothetical protein